jgi:hypothetical protein
LNVTVVSMASGTRILPRACPPKLAHDDSRAKAGLTPHTIGGPTHTM